MIPKDLYSAGWRPFYGWASGIGFFYAVLIQPLLSWYSSIRGIPVPPTLNIDLLWVVVTGMLGLGGMRTYEKRKQVAKQD